jgi:hypothetical protein
MKSKRMSVPKGMLLPCFFMVVSFPWKGAIESGGSVRAVPPLAFPEPRARAVRTGSVNRDGVRLRACGLSAPRQQRAGARLHPSTRRAALLALAKDMVETLLRTIPNADRSSMATACLEHFAVIVVVAPNRPR